MEKTKQKPWKRLLAALLAVALIWCAAPPLVRQVQAASWMDSYLNQVVEWGVMRGDLQGNLEPNRDITRAEFCTMINRAFGYTEVGPHPFTDVKSKDWYADDIAIAYNQGYLFGTSATTASPNDPLTREQAMVILGKNLMLQIQPGEVLGFTDSRTFSDWAKGWIRAVAECGIISGYPDGTFRPRNNISRGETATILVKAIGNLVKEPGETTLGGVYGNVVVNTSGVHLKDTVIAGNLYITGGVGLGDVLLDNVTVLGRIVVSGAGESNAGESSVILRNVSAQEMVVDGLSNQFVSIRAEGDTTIDVTHVRTDAYIEDATESPYGLLSIQLDGENGLSLQVAGNIKEVINKTPDSHLTIAQGPAATVTIDEEAINSTLTIEQGASVGNLNLDVGTTVDGEGDISHANVNAPGCSIEQLPDTIVIRPGITADVNGDEMDSTAAAESSADPRLLAGYPAAKNVAPTSANGVFAANKSATIYWALSATTDGSVEEDDLIEPPAYGGGILDNGTIQVGSSGEEGTAKLSGLNSDGAYYISAIAVDNRGKRSPVKVTAFSTPDNTVPKFTSGYPYMSKITNTSGQVAVMANKSCQLYYAVFPKGSEAPTVQDFKTGSLSGNLGSGIRDVTRNVIDLFYVNNQNLQEQVEYDLYLCLIDADGGLNSNVQKLTFKTVDGTPPVFVTEPTVTSVQVTSVGLQAMLNENGTIYWALVAQGDEYPDPIMGATERPALDELAAKVAVATGAGALKSGSVKATANKNVTLNITGLDRETGYDLYYVAQDTAGNYSQTVRKITIHTLDNTPPSVEQQFTKTADEEGTEPMADTDIELVFSEGILDSKELQVFYELYLEGDTDKLADLLREDVILQVRGNNNRWENVSEKQGTGENQLQWVDYNKVEVEMKDGKTIIRFPYDDGNGAVKLASGGTYRFELNRIADTSDNRNPMQDGTLTPVFTTAFARIDLASTNIAQPPQGSGGDVQVDMAFEMYPLSTGAVSVGANYDIFLWANLAVEFELYSRVVDLDGNEVKDATDPMADIKEDTTGAGNSWTKLGSYSITTNNNEWRYTSVRNAGNTQATFPWLRNLNERYTYQYAIHVTKVMGNPDPDTWSQNVEIRVTLPAGVDSNLRNAGSGSNCTENNWNNLVASGDISPVGDPENFSVSRQFTDQTPPTFVGSYPMFRPSDSFVDMEFILSRRGTIYYVLAPVNVIIPTDTEGNEVKEEDVPEGGANPTPPLPKLKTPTQMEVYNGDFSDQRIKKGTVTADTAAVVKRVENLSPETTYYAFFVVQGDSQNLSDVYMYKFTTTGVEVPEIGLSVNGNVVTIETHVTSSVEWIVIPKSYGNDKNSYAILGEPFSKYCEGGETAWQTKVDELIKDGTNITRSATVLDALLTRVGTSNQTVFDLLANETAYNTLYNYVVDKTGGTTTDQGNIPELVANVGQKVTCKLDEIGQYYFIAAARHVQGQEYAFHAVGGVQMADTTPPKYDLFSPEVYAFAAWPGTDEYQVLPSKFLENPANFMYKGTITLGFNEPIYYYNGGNPIKVDNSNIKNLIGKSSSIKIDNATVSTENGGGTITIEYSAATHNANFTIFNAGRICDAAGNSINNQIKLTFNALEKNVYPVWTTDPLQSAS